MIQEKVKRGRNLCSTRGVFKHLGITPVAPPILRPEWSRPESQKKELRKFLS